MHGQGQQNLFSKWPDSTYFKLCEPHSLPCTCSPLLCYVKAAMDGVQRNKCSCVHVQKPGNGPYLPMPDPQNVSISLPQHPSSHPFPFSIPLPPPPQVLCRRDSSHFTQSPFLLESPSLPASYFSPRTLGACALKFCGFSVFLLWACTQAPLCLCLREDTPHTCIPPTSFVCAGCVF